MNYDPLDAVDSNEIQKHDLSADQKKAYRKRNSGYY